MTSFLNLLCGRAVFLAALGAVATAGCSSADAEPMEASDSDQVGSAPLSDAALARALASPPAKLTPARAERLVRSTIDPVATTERLKLLNDFIAAGLKTYPSTEAYGTLASEMEGLYWGTPRDIVSSPAGLGGQTLTTSAVFDSGTTAPTRLKVIGSASADYKLDFTISNAHVTVDRVPAGSTPEATAKLIAAAIVAANDAIMATISARQFDPIGGDHAENQSGVDDVEVSTEGDTVVILVAQNGG
jgi:hypothetical protein